MTSQGTLTPLPRERLPCLSPGREEAGGGEASEAVGQAGPEVEGASSSASDSVQAGQLGTGLAGEEAPWSAPGFSANAAGGPAGAPVSPAPARAPQAVGGGNGHCLSRGCC